MSVRLPSSLAWATEVAVFAKGTFFVGRRAYISERFGESAWDEFLRDLGREDPVFAKPILATTLVPIESYFLFHDRSVERFFRGDAKALWTIGEKSAEWSLTHGPYKHLKNNPQSLAEFVAKLPLIWSAFFTEGRLESKMVDETTIEIELLDLPVSHSSFEDAVMGYGKRAIELVSSRTVTEHRLLGMQRGRNRVHYRFVLR
ncbi:MAG: hypothetical protein JNK05_38505 [Myxococcales bacterium]|nr:hypothetical protein [Myxococcales bacterium]